MWLTRDSESDLTEAASCDFHDPHCHGPRLDVHRDFFPQSVFTPAVDTSAAAEPLPGDPAGRVKCLAQFPFAAYELEKSWPREPRPT